MVRNSSERLFQYFQAAKVEAAYAYIDETIGNMCTKVIYYK